VTANLGLLANGGQASVTITAKINCDVANGSVISNTASVTSSTLDPNPGNNNASPAALTVSNQVPSIGVSLAINSLSQNNHELINVGLSASAGDNLCQIPGPLNVQVFSDEDDQTATAPNEIYSPDAKDIQTGTLRLRAERASSGDGRVYLIVLKATDAAGGVGFATAAVVVPKSPNAANVASVNSQASAALSFANANKGNPPAGYFLVGDGPIIGSKQ